jgi:ADP-ribose pyrophosphatase YjhB (NUDIX family)
MKHFAVSGVVFIEDKVLLVRHTYGMAINKLLIPGGHVKDKEMPTDAIVREIWEETRIMTEVESIISVQFKPEQWFIIFKMKYLSGIPEADQGEVSEVMLLTPEDALQREDITLTSRVILETIRSNQYRELRASSFCSSVSKPSEYKIFGVI